MCKSISLIPHRKRQERNKLKSGNSLISWLFPCTNPNVVMDFGDQKSENELMYEDGASEGTAIWRTFFEIVDDTAQIAKSHSAFAESLKTQLGDPLKTALHEMETEKKTIVGEGQQAARELEKSGNALLKARSRYDSCALEAVRLRDAASLAVSAAQRNGNSIEENKMVNREKMLLEKAKIAEDAIVVARKALKAAEEAHRQTHSRHHATDLPRVMAVSFMRHLPIDVYKMSRLFSDKKKLVRN